MNGKKLKALREKSSDKIQKEFCEAFKISQSTLSLWENEKREPSAQTVKDIANYYHVSIDYLMDNEKNINENTLLKIERELTKEEKERLYKLLELSFPEAYKKGTQ